jgi:hypothetical protein
VYTDFQQLEVDYCAGKPDPEYCEPSQRHLQTVPIVRIFGVTDEGMLLCNSPGLRRPQVYLHAGN